MSVGKKGFRFEQLTAGFCEKEKRGNHLIQQSLVQWRRKRQSWRRSGKDERERVRFAGGKRLRREDGGRRR
jgi:hypothetical protein